MYTEIKITADGKGMLSHAIQMAMTGHRTVDAYKVVNGQLILAWGYDHKFPHDYSKLPFSINAGQVIEFVWGWLGSVEPAMPEPDTDGCTGKGFEFYHRDFDAYESDTYSLLVVKPIWMVYGK